MKTIIKSFLKRGSELSLDFKIKQGITFIFYPANLALPSNSNSHYMTAEASEAEMKGGGTQGKAGPGTLVEIRV